MMWWEIRWQLIRSMCWISFTKTFHKTIRFAPIYGIFKQNNRDCVTAVQRSIEQVEILLRHKIGQRSLNEKFKWVFIRTPILCPTIASEQAFPIQGCAIQSRTLPTTFLICRTSSKVLPAILPALFNTTKTIVPMPRSPLMMSVMLWWKRSLVHRSITVNQYSSYFHERESIRSSSNCPLLHFTGGSIGGRQQNVAGSSKPNLPGLQLQ